jgi:transposase
MGRDLNAAINILASGLRAKNAKLATAGIAGSNACEDEATVSSVKQEAHGFSRG